MPYTYPYPRMLVTVDAVVLLEISGVFEKILLIKRGNDPYKDHFALPGGFPEFDELLEDAAKRELFEETGLSGIELHQLAAFDSVDRDPRDRNIAIAFIGITNESNSEVKAGDDASEAKWFDLKNLPSLAFDHKQIIESALKKVKQ